jgi:hypothetical protein
MATPPQVYKLNEMNDPAGEINPMDEYGLAVSNCNQYLMKLDYWEKAKPEMERLFPDAITREGITQAVMKGITCPTDIPGINLESMDLFKRALNRPKLNKERFKTVEMNLELHFSKINRWRAELKVLRTSTPEKREHHDRPMTAKAIEEHTPKMWAGSNDSRTTSEFLDQIFNFVTVQKCVKQKYCDRECFRLTLSLVPPTESRLLNDKFQRWRKEGTGPVDDMWPTRELAVKWLNESLANPVTEATLRAEFNKLAQTGKGLNGLNSFCVKIVSDYLRLKELNCAPDDFSAKTLFRDKLDTSIRSKIPEYLTDSVLLDKTQSFEALVTATQERALANIQGTGTAAGITDSQPRTPRQWNTRKEMTKAINTAAVNAVKTLQGTQGGGKKGKGAKRQLAALLNQVEEVTKRAKGAPKGGKGGKGKGGKGKGGKGKGSGKKLEYNADGSMKVPKNWKEEMCDLCGILYHSKDKCFHNDQNKGTRPPGFEKASAADIAEKKKQRVALYESA